MTAVGGESHQIAPKFATTIIITKLYWDKIVNVQNGQLSSHSDILIFKQFNSICKPIGDDDRHISHAIGEN